MTARPPLRVLGIDPGTASTGFGVVDSGAQALSTVTGGVISTGSDVPLERRLAAIAGHLSELLDEHEPDALAIEEVFFGRNVRSAFAVGQARGAVLAAAGRACGSVLLVHAAGGQARGVRQRRRAPRTRCRGWSPRCWGWRRRRPPTTPPMRSHSRSATPSTCERQRRDTLSRGVRARAQNPNT